MLPDTAEFAQGTTAASSLDDVIASLSDNDDETALEGTCAICFNEYNEFAALPCKCKIQYCSPCWDRSLAMSFARVGHPQCPSCRSPFTADLDEQTGHLVFYPATDAEAAANWRPQLYQKTKPVQVRLLQDFGIRCCQPEAAQGKKGDSKSRFCEPLDLTSPNFPSPCSGIAVAPGANLKLKPSCACGADLRLVSARKRIELMLDELASDWRSRPGVDEEKLLIRLMKSRVIVCDLCSESATTSGAVWTCSNGPRTILHATGYDICECCFQKYTGVSCSLGLAGPSQADSSGDDVLVADRRKNRRTPPLMAAARLAISKGFQSFLQRTAARNTSTTGGQTIENF